MCLDGQVFHFSFFPPMFGCNCCSLDFRDILRASASKTFPFTFCSDTKIFCSISYIFQTLNRFACDLSSYTVESRCRQMCLHEQHTLLGVRNFTKTESIRSNLCQTSESLSKQWKIQVGWREAFLTTSRDLISSHADSCGSLIVPTDSLLLERRASQSGPAVVLVSAPRGIEAVSFYE